MWSKVLVCCAFLVAFGSAQQNAVQNHGFESELRGHWESDGFSISRSSDAHGGSHSLRCAGRMHNSHQGPAQLVTLTPGKMYKFSAYVKQLTDMPGTLFQKYRAIMQYQDSGTGKHSQENLAYHTTVRSVDGWFRMAAFFRAPTQAVSLSKLKIQAPDISIDFLLDDVTIVELPDLADWKTEANQRINQLRMGDIHFRFNLGPGISASDIDVQIDHVKHLFGWGTLVKDQWMIDSNYRHYQDMVYEYFNTATTQGLKWKFDKGTATHPDYSQAMACVDSLRQKGMLVRAHNLFWGFEKNLPPYVVHMAPHQLNVTVQNHLNYMINITKGKADHWDVMNELVHGQWFEEQFHNPDYSQDVYRQVKQLDPKPLLMLNDFNVVARPEIADAYLQQSQKFLSQGVPLQALGLQGHFHETVPDPQRMMLYLDHVAQAGLPLWVTELDVQQQDPDVRADYYDTALRVLFSHPAMHGIVLWGFWDQHVVDKRSALVDGNNLNINAAGKQVFHLIKDEWSTHVHRTLSSGTDFHLRGFKGDYEVTVKSHGVNVKVVHFSLTGNQTTVNINVDSTRVLSPHL
ncbi:anti-sigma-I factor RsgI6-like [Littorina saxatilis]|uniref:GH10 domain-containing protein n=1 Tax=Littorina saxatilis TaxID=31220 RepID=A0AAN9C3E4_9CAEN